ncbi:MAG: hypothetical protein WC829_01055 [Hyphomicrobium sp.]
MNMIEKVARALAWKDWNTYHAKDSLLDDVSLENVGVDDNYLVLARAAIEAMEIPTPDMVACAESQFALFADEYGRAIRAALKEE